MGLIRSAALWGIKAVAWARKQPLVRKLLSEVSFGFNRLRMHEMMLNDTVKIDHFYEGIRRNVKPGDTVLDLGTGTGILAFFAAAKEPKQIYAVEQLDIIETAKEIARANGLDWISFFQGDCLKFDPGERMDVIIHEQLGNRLFDSDLVNTLVDCRDRLLKEGGRILPGRFEYYLEPVMLEDRSRQPFIWEKRINGLDLSGLREYAEDYTQTEKVANITPDAVKCFLSEPERIYCCDLHTMAKTDLPHSMAQKKVLARDGRLDGFLVFFKAFFDSEFGFSTWNPEGATHWGLSLLRVEAQKCRKGQELAFQLQVEDWTDLETWRWEHRLQ